jgi:hypothetical protein
MYGFINCKKTTSPPKNGRTWKKFGSQVRVLSQKAHFQRFLSRSNGYKYLSESFDQSFRGQSPQRTWVMEECLLWKDKLNMSYAISIESALAEIFSPSLYKQREIEQP